MPQPFIIRVKKDYFKKKKVSEESIEKICGQTYLFKNVPYEKRILEEVIFSTNLLDNRSNKTQDEWLDFSENNADWVVPDAELLYQIMRISFENRDKNKKVIESFVGELRPVFYNYDINSLSCVSYGSGSLVYVKKLGNFFGETKPKTIKIPNFKKDYLEYDCNLSEKRGEEQLEETLPIPKHISPLLEAILGNGYEKAGQVFSYFTFEDESEDECALMGSKLIISKGDTEKDMILFGISDCFYLGIYDENSEWSAFGVKKLC